MKKFLAVLCIGLTMACAAVDADAAGRFGGGMSFGRSAPALRQSMPAQRAPALSQQKSNTSQATKPAAAGVAGAGAATAAAASPWRGMLMGAATALGIAGLMNALGLSGSFAEALTMVLLVFVIYYVIRVIAGIFMMKKAGTRGIQAPGAQASAYRTERPADRSWQPGYSDTGARAGSVMDSFSGGQQGVQADAASLSIPEGFDVEGFEKVAKENFLSLQRAWDTGNVIEISDFTTDEIFREVTHKLRERGGVKQASEVVNIEPKLLGITEESGEYVAVIRFTGAMKYSGVFEEFQEDWILTQKIDGKAGWLLAGIQQVEN